jgi:hypothetical protein
MPLPAALISHSEWHAESSAAAPGQELAAKAAEFGPQ